MTRRYLPFLTGGLALLIAGQARLLTHYDDLRGGMILIGSGLTLIVITRLLQASPEAKNERRPNLDSNAKHPTFSPPTLTLPGVWLMGLGALLAYGLGLFAHSRPLIYSYEFLFGLWGLSAACFLTGTLHPDELRQRWQAFRQRFWGETWYRIAVAISTALALLVRAAGLESWPQPFSFDEAAFALDAARLAEGSLRASPFEPGWLSHPYLHFFFIAASIKLLGRGILAARLPSAILGALTVPAIYALGRETYDRWVGLVAALFMTGFQLHVHFSRLALNNIADPLWGALAFTFLLRGLRSGRHSDFGLAGLLLGIAQYFYAGARLLPVMALAFLLITWLARSDWLLGRWVQLGTLIGGLLIATWPADWFYIVERQPLTTRLSATSLWQTGQFERLVGVMGVPGAIWHQSKAAWLALIHTYDVSGFYGPVAPVMGPFAGVPLLAGVLYVLVPCRGAPRATSWLPILWMVMVVTAGSVLLTYPPQYPRYVLLTPAAALLVGVGMVETARMLFLTSKVIRHAAMIGLAMLLAVADLLFYSLVYLPSPAYAHDSYTLLGAGAAQEIAIAYAQNPNVRIYYLTAPASRLDGSSLIDYFAPGVNDRHLNTLSEGFELADEMLFILDASRLAELEELVKILPGGLARTVQDGFGRVVFVVYRVGR